MQAIAELTEAPVPATTTTATTTTIPVHERPRRSAAFGLMGAGFAVLALAGGLLATVPHTKAHHAVAPAAVAPAAAAPAQPAPGAIAIQSPGDITVLNMTYEPGQSSGWHHHRGIHAVAVISGQITVYDQNCVAHTYGPGDAYIGGQLQHFVRNEGTEPAVMVVTYVNPIGPAPAQVAPAAAPCDVH